MLVPRPPLPVGRRRAVAEVSVAWKQAAPIRAGHVYELPPPTPPVPEVAESADPPLSQSGHDTPI
jgi:hypothetical protein